MPESVRVFLSTVSDEFRAYRDQLRGDLTRPDVEVKVQEDFKDLGGVTLEKLDDYIKLCDAVVHLVGDMTGADARPLSTKAILEKYPDLPGKFPPLGEALAQGFPISYTQWEAGLALYHGKVLLIAKADDAAPRGPLLCADGRLPRSKRISRDDAPLNAIPAAAHSRAPIISPNRSPTRQFSICWRTLLHPENIRKTKCEHTRLLLGVERVSRRNRARSGKKPGRPWGDKGGRSGYQFRAD